MIVITGSPPLITARPVASVGSWYWWPAPGSGPIRIDVAPIVIVPSLYVPAASSITWCIASSLSSAVLIAHGLLEVQSADSPGVGDA